MDNALFLLWVRLLTGDSEQVSNGVICSLIHISNGLMLAGVSKTVSSAPSTGGWLPNNVVVGFQK